MAKKLLHRPKVSTILRLALLLGLMAAMLGAGSLGARTRALAAPAESLNAVRSLAGLPATTCPAGCNLYAKEGSVTLPDGTIVPIWGFTDSIAGVAQLPGPTLIVEQGVEVNVTLFNEIPGEIISLGFPGMDLVPDLTGVATGGSVVYTFTPAEPGTYLYEAGLTNNGARQVAMGLYGALIVRPTGAPLQAYDLNSTYNDEALLVFSEIDTRLNNDPAGFAMNRFKPQYFLINGKAYGETGAIPTSEGSTVLLRYVNAGIQARFINILGLSHTIVGESGSQLAYPKRMVVDTLPAGQTLDLLVQIPVSLPDGTRFPIFEAGMNNLHNAGALAADNSVAFGGMLTQLVVTGSAVLADSGPLASNVVVTPDISAGTEVVLSFTLDDTNTGGDPVVGAEYFIDTLLIGAPGSGTLVNVPVSDVNVSLTALIDAATLATWEPGDVTFYVRGQDASGAWGPVSSTVLDLVKAGPIVRGLTIDPASANGSKVVRLQATGDDTTLGNVNVVAAEYFIDGIGADGSGTPMGLNMIAPITSLTADISTEVLAGLGDGLHEILVHAQDELGNWGGFTSIFLHIDRSGPTFSSFSLTPNPNNGMQSVHSSTYSIRARVTFNDETILEQAEGFIDTIKADGSGFPMLPVDGLFNATSEQTYVNIPLTTIRLLPDGPHSLYFHAKDAAGNWGSFAEIVLVVDKAGPITSGLTVTPNPTGGSPTVTLEANVADANVASAPGSVIVAAEWFEGFDPGVGMGTPMVATDGVFDSSIEAVTTTIDISGWTNGDHSISVRGKDAAGNWGAAQTVTLSVGGNLMNQILMDGFESNNLYSAWNFVVGRVNPSPEARLDGVLGVKTDIREAKPAFLVDYTPSAESGYRATFQFDPNSLDTAGSVIDIFAGENRAGLRIFGLQYEKNTSGLELRAYVEANGSRQYTQWHKIADAAQQIEIAWNSAGNGSFEFGIDGALQETVFGDTSAYRLETVKLGPSSDLANGLAGVLYFDAFESYREGINRPFPDPGVGYQIFLPSISSAYTQ